MSPPEPDPKKMERKHRPALRGMALAVVATLLVILGVLSLGTPDEANEAASGDEELAD